MTEGLTPSNPLAGIPATTTWAYTEAMRKNIRIENPVAGEGWTSSNRAKRFVAKGVAEWVRFGESIRFLRQGDHQTHSVRRVVDETAMAYDRAANGGMATLDELRNLPLVRPAVALGIKHPKGATRHTFLATQGF